MNRMASQITEYDADGLPVIRKAFPYHEAIKMR